MGYNTFCSLPSRAFIGRTCLVLTKNHQIDRSLAISLRGLRELEEYYNSHSELSGKTNYVIGGSAIFELFFSENLIDSAVVTHIDGEYEGDAKFPLHFIADWQKKTLGIGVGFTIVLHTKRGTENGN